jgi:outer membrane protein TolC
MVISKRTYCQVALVLVLLLINGQWSMVNSQHTVRLDLDRTISLATDSSYSAQKYQSVYDASLFNFLSWQASRKVQISLESSPVQYERYITQRYVSEDDVDIYREQRMLYSQAGIHAEQPIEMLGGSLYGSTQLGYMRTFGNSSATQFMTVPISIGYKQDLLGFNGLKWNRRIEPLKLALAEKQLAYNTELASVEAVAKFFALALAQDQLRMSEEYIASCDTIYSIAEKRYKIASISKAELSILELEKVNARNTLANARIAKQQTMQDLASYLGMDLNTNIELVIPSDLANLKISTEDAIAFARDNNPMYLSAQQQTLEAKMTAERARVEKNLSMSINASVGLNQVADNFADAYRRPLVQDMATIKVSIPLKDWGKRKNAYLAAQSQVEAAEKTELETARITELDVLNSVTEFNERQAIVETSRQALTIAENAYTATLQRFIRAQANVNDLSLAQSHWQTARQNQIASLQHYWAAYYHLRCITLYDFQRKETIRHNRQ